MSEKPPVPIPEAEDDLAQVRALILGSHTDLVPELVHGETIADLVASIEPARAAYSRVMAAVPAPPVRIPAGGNAPITIDIDALPTAEKIRRGLARSSS